MLIKKELVSIIAAATMDIAAMWHGLSRLFHLNFEFGFLRPEEVKVSSVSLYHSTSGHNYFLHLLASTYLTRVSMQGVIRRLSLLKP